MIEERPIPGFRNATARSDGRIFRGDKELRGYADPTRGGYLRTSMYENGRRYNASFHRLVCMAFHGVPTEPLDVDHINGDRLDNRPSNLRWCTHIDNVLFAVKAGTHIRGHRSGRAKLHTSQAYCAKAFLSAGVSPRKVAQWFPFSPESAASLKYGYSWRHLKLAWELSE